LKQGFFYKSFRVIHFDVNEASLNDTVSVTVMSISHRAALLESRYVCCCGSNAPARDRASRCCTSSHQRAVQRYESFD
jgi:hypothetical protein